jgi:hypothetical protein
MEDVGISILWTFGQFLRTLGTYIYRHLVYFVAIWYFFSRFGMLLQEKSGNPDLGEWPDSIFGHDFGREQSLVARTRMTFHNVTGINPTSVKSHFGVRVTRCLRDKNVKWDLEIAQKIAKSTLRQIKQ